LVEYLVSILRVTWLVIYITIQINVLEKPASFGGGRGVFVFEMCAVFYLSVIIAV